MDLNSIIKTFNKNDKIIQEDEEAVILSIEEFWNENHNYEDDTFEIPPIIKNITIGIVAVIIAITIGIIGHAAVKTISKIGQQERLYQLALKEVDTYSYSSAISHFKNIEQSSKHYYEAKKYIRKLTNVQRYLRQAQDFYDKDELAFALEKVNSIYILVDRYKPAEDLKNQILERMELKTSQADIYIAEGNAFVQAGNYEQAKEKLNMANQLYPNYKGSVALKESIASYAESLANNANQLYNNFKIAEASKVNKQALSLNSNLKLSLELEDKLKSYNDGVALAEKAAALFVQRKFIEAEETMARAVAKNSFIETEYSALLSQIKDSEKIVDAINQYKEKINITQVTFINSGTEYSPQINVMFCLENTTDDIIEFNAYWCSILNRDLEIFPTPYSAEQMSIVAKILPNGLTDSELENDYFYMKKGEKYKILMKFDGSKESLNNATLYYTDYNQEIPLKIDLAQIS